MQHFRGWQIGLLYVVFARLSNLAMPSENGFRRHRSAAGNVADIEVHIVERVERAAVSDADDDAVGQFLL